MSDFCFLIIGSMCKNVCVYNHIQYNNNNEGLSLYFVLF